MNAIVFLLLRLGIGISMFGHGLVRLPKLNAFSQWMVGSFAKSMLPAELVRPFSMVLPFAELAIGFLLLIGLFYGTGAHFRRRSGSAIAFRDGDGRELGGDTVATHSPDFLRGTTSIYSQQLLVSR